MNALQLPAPVASVLPAVVEAQPAAQNPARVYLAGLSTGSRRTMAQALNVIADIAAPGATLDTLRWDTLRYAHTQAIRARLAERQAATANKALSAATVNKALSALRGTLKAAWRLGQFTPTRAEVDAARARGALPPSGADLYMAAADVASVKGEKPAQAAGHAVTLGELMALVAACNDGTAAGARDAAMLGLAYAGGLRRAEVVALNRDDLDTVTGVLTVRGKRSKTRTVPVHNGALSALQAWLAVRGEAAGPLFYPVRKGGHMHAGRLSTQAVYSAFRGRAQAANVRAFSPHDLRRTFAGDMLDAGVDIATVQKMMGHASVSTTAGYDRRGERAKQDAAKRLHFPYQAPRPAGRP